MKQFICLFLLLFSILFTPPSFIYAEEGSSAVPPIPGGVVTSPAGYRVSPTSGTIKMHSGIDVGIDDVMIVAPTDGYVIHGSGHGFGDGYVYFESADGAYPTKLRLFFGDLHSSTETYPTGYVSKGTPIGYVLGFDPDVSTGPHVHIEFHTRGSPEEYFQTIPDGAADPVPILTALGVDLSGATDYSGPNAGSDNYGSDDIIAKEFWTVDNFHQIGEVFQSLIDFWSDKARLAAQVISPYSMYLLAVLCVLDLTLPIILSGLSCNVKTLIMKVIRYSSIMGIVILWTSFINDILLSFITSWASIIGNDIHATPDLSQPQLLFDKAVTVIAPAMSKIGSFTTWDYLFNLGTVILIYIFTFIVIIAFIVATVFICLAYIEFYLSAGLALVTVPFTSWSLSKFIPEGTLGHLLSSAMKLLIMSVMIGMCTIAIDQAKPTDIFKTGSYEAPVHTPNPTGNNPYIKMIMGIALEEHINPYIAISIAARETGGDDVNAINMASDGGLFQITPGQQGYDPDTGEIFMISDRYPDYASNPKSNIRAGMAILNDKIRMTNGDIWKAVQWYNSADPSMGDPDYLSKVKANYEKINGLPIGAIGHQVISTESITKYGRLCTALLTIALMIIFLPSRLMSILGGHFELHFGDK